MEEKNDVAETGGPRFPFAEYRRLRFGGAVLCPRCGGRAMGWGRFAGRRRYRCRACRRTFSDFTGTPLAYLKKVERWPLHCAAIKRGDTLREEAASIGIDRHTAFRWRHRLLASLDDADAGPLTGLVVVRRWAFPLSRKGSRSVETPRRRGYPRGWRYLSAPSTWVVFAEDADRRIASRVAGTICHGISTYRRVLGPRLEGAELLPKLELLAASGRRRIRRRLPDARERVRLRHVLVGYIAQMRRWSTRFRGVATRYLGNYLAWHRFLEMIRRAGDPRPLRRLILVSFP